MTDNEGFPKCPHCDTELDHEQMWYGEDRIGKVYVGDGDTSDLKCPNDDCKKTYHVTCYHDLRFVNIDENGDDI